MSGQVKCSCCGCTEENPCRLETGDTCMLSVATSRCNNPRCVLAAVQANKVLARKQREEKARLVRPILDRWIAFKRQKKEAQQRKFRKTKRAAR